MIRVVRTLPELSAALGNHRPAFVPTMGALHAGHLALVRRAVELSPDGAPVVVSIFVNPAQFGPSEDYARYPRMLDADVASAESAGANVVFAPEISTMYPVDGAVRQRTPPLPTVATQPGLEDAHRPTHFAGVCQAVARLFDLIRPSSAIFGEKDFQQLLVVKAMAAMQRHRWPALKVVAHPTIREADGLAMSSRNAYLKPEQRQGALGLFRALQAARGQSNVIAAENAMKAVLSDHGLKIDYAVVRDAAILMPVESLVRPARALIAARLGSVRLIDNIALGE